MALHTKADFAALCGMNTKRLATYALATRRKVVYSGDYVNDAIEPNKSFLQKWSGRKGTIKAIDFKPKPEKPVKKLQIKEPEFIPEPIPNIGEDENSPAPYIGLDGKKIETQIRKMEKEIEKLSISNQKIKGQLMPVVLIDSLFLQHNQSILTESKNILQDILLIFGKRRDLNASEKADISSEFTDRLNEMMKRAADMTNNAIPAMLAAFSYKRGVGERER